MGFLKRLFGGSGTNVPTELFGVPVTHAMRVPLDLIVNYGPQSGHVSALEHVGNEWRVTFTWAENGMRELSSTGDTPEAALTNLLGRLMSEDHMGKS